MKCLGNELTHSWDLTLHVNMNPRKPSCLEGSPSRDLSFCGLIFICTSAKLLIAGVAGQRQSGYAACCQRLKTKRGEREICIFGGPCCSNLILDLDFTFFLKPGGSREKGRVHEYETTEGFCSGGAPTSKSQKGS